MNLGAGVENNTCSAAVFVMHISSDLLRTQHILALAFPFRLLIGYLKGLYNMPISLVGYPYEYRLTSARATKPLLSW
jgi:hypothetical protein